MDKKEFWDKYDLLNKDFLKNYDELENLFVQQLREEGLDFFELSQIFLLGKFESTLPQFCKACENNIQNFNQYMLINILFSYVHLNDLKNAKRIRQILKEDGFDDERPTMLDGIDDFLPSTNFFQGRYITAKYDKRIKDLGKYIISDLGKVEEFIIKEWKDFLPKRMYFNLIYGIGPSPYNILLSEAYFKVGHYNKSKFICDYVLSKIVHEVTHFIKNNFLQFQMKKNEVSSLKFIDEGYAEWKRTEYLEKHTEYKIYADNCAYHILGSNLFELSDLKNKWFTVMFDFLNCPIYETATSFTYFLEDTFGYDKINSFWESIPNYPKTKTWTDYLKIYFEKDLIDLMKEWKKIILKNNGSRESTSEEIITHFELEQIDKDNMIFHYTSKYPLWAGHNIFIYDDKMKLQSIDKVEKYRFLKEGHLAMKSVESEKLTVYAHFFQYSQKTEFKLP